jgi:hypothetical protein
LQGNRLNTSLKRLHLPLQAIDLVIAARRVERRSGT